MVLYSLLTGDGCVERNPGPVGNTPAGEASMQAAGGWGGQPQPQPTEAADYDTFAAFQPVAPLLRRCRAMGCGLVFQGASKAADLLRGRHCLVHPQPPVGMDYNGSLFFKPSGRWPQQDVWDDEDGPAVVGWRRLVTAAAAADER